MNFAKFLLLIAVVLGYFGSPALALAGKVGLLAQTKIKHHKRAPKIKVHHASRAKRAAARTTSFKPAKTLKVKMRALRPRTVRQTPKNSAEAAANLSADLMNSISAMQDALPIYSGYRERAAKSAFKALGIAEKALYGARAPIRTKPTVKDNGAANSTST